MYSTDDVAEYYNHTQHHYIKWWNLKSSLALHYGIWGSETKNLSEALTNTNMLMMELAEVKQGEWILDAGCGVGGAAFFLSSVKQAHVTGITISEKQFMFAQREATVKGLSDKVTFHVMDYTKTNFDDETFDLVWACESVASASDQNNFIAEAARVLKKGGRLVVSDYFLADQFESDKENLLDKWLSKWCISKLWSQQMFASALEANGFEHIRTVDYTDAIRRSSRRMYFASLIGAVPSQLYNLFHPGIKRVAADHYKSGFYQYKALNRNLWRYIMVVAVKK